MISLRRLECDLLFLKACKKEELIPKFVRFRLANPRLATDKLIHKCYGNILQAEIRYKKKELTHLHRFVRRQKEELKHSIPNIVYLRLCTIATAIVSLKILQWRRGHEKKLSMLRSEKYYKVQRNEVLDPIVNLSKRSLTDVERKALENGLHHVYSTGKLDYAQLLCNTEYFYARLLNFRTSYRHWEQKSASEKVLHQLSSEQLRAAGKLRNCVETFTAQSEKQLCKFRNEHKDIFQALRGLAKDKNIVITRPDKGRGVVILDRHEYIEKMNVILQDTATFSRIYHDPTLSNENRLTRELLRLKKDGFISESEYSLAKPIGSRPARLYGLPKIHKNDMPLRPILSATKTVNYGLGKVLAQRLAPLRKSPYVIRDTFDFIKKISAFDKNLIKSKMVSFDVVNLFTKVPLTYTVDLILDELYPKCSTSCQGNTRGRHCKQCNERNDFGYLLRTATSDTHFTFDGKMYIQHNGVSMGSPLAPVIADIFMAHLENTLYNRLEKAGVKKWLRYVDDTFVLLAPDASVEDIVEILNTFHRSIRFTCEKEENGYIPFLDVKVIRSLNSNQFQTTVHRKKTFSGLMTKWSSCVPHSYKKSAI
ncbi:unnamed protein product, partial [Didymodactylos carnosus]